MEDRRKLHGNFWQTGHGIARDNCTIRAKKSQGFKSFKSCIEGFSHLFSWNRYLRRKRLASSTSTHGGVGLRTESCEDSLSSVKAAGTGYRTAIKTGTAGKLRPMVSMNGIVEVAIDSHQQRPHADLKHLLRIKQEPFALQEAIHEKQHSARRKIDTNPSRDDQSTDKSTEIKVGNYINLYRRNRKLVKNRPASSDCCPDGEVIKFDYHLNENQRTRKSKSSFFTDMDGVSVKSDHNHGRSFPSPSEARVSTTVTSPARPSTTFERFSSSCRSYMICGSKQHKSRVPGKKKIRRKAKLMEAAHRILEGSSRSSPVTALTVSSIADDHHCLFGHQTVMEKHSEYLPSSHQLDQQYHMTSSVRLSSASPYSDIKPTAIRKTQKKKSKMGSSVQENAQNITISDDMQCWKVVTSADCVEEDPPHQALDVNAKPVSDPNLHFNDSIAAEFQSGVIINTSCTSPLRICDFSWWDAMELHDAMEQFSNDNHQLMDSKHDTQSPPSCLQQHGNLYCPVDSHDNADMAMLNQSTAESVVTSNQTVNDCQEQLSPVSVLDPPFFEDESNCLDEINNDDFDARFEESRHHLLEKVCRLEQLAEMDMETLMKTYGEIEESHHSSASDLAYSDSEQSASESEPSISYQLSTGPEHEPDDHLSSALAPANRRFKPNYHHLSQIKESVRARAKHSKRSFGSSFRWSGSVQKAYKVGEMDWMSEGVKQAIAEEIGAAIVSNLLAGLIEELLLEML